MHENIPVVQAKAQPTKLPDAGLKENDYYAQRLPRWRYDLREALLPLVRWETPYLAIIQRNTRCSFLDSFFALTANLGTHTFFMGGLPILFWSGRTETGRALVHMLALGVLWSGWAKDLVCLPRPLSPPLQRISMSRSAALEYGFPSTHATNAVSVAAYFLYSLHTDSNDLTPSIRIPALSMGYAYLLSIVLGRLYCGMHGFFDVTCGSGAGAAIAVLWILGGSTLDDWIETGSWVRLFILVLTILLAVRFYPEPADNCPCFDDSVAFAGTLIGINAGHWHFSRSSLASSYPVPGTVPFSLETLGYPRAIFRVVFGVVVVFLWRAVMKPTLLRTLPPVFRLIEHVGLSLPRRFFTEASQYNRVPPLRKDDNVIPPAKDISAFFTSLGNSRKRTVSVGPQSEADAREFIANRTEQRRRQSRTASDRPGSRSDVSATTAYSLRSTLEHEALQFGDDAPSIQNGHSHYNEPVDIPGVTAGTKPASQSDTDARNDAAMFHALETPRVRYDVEVVTRLVVYTGIGWLAAEGAPILFDLFGLGMTPS